MSIAEAQTTLRELEASKKEELRTMASEKEALQLREEALLKEVQDMERQIFQQVRRVVWPESLIR